jgi:hypothetical protein
MYIYILEHRSFLIVFVCLIDCVFQHRLRVFENRVLRRIFGSTRDK